MFRFEGRRAKDRARIDTPRLEASSYLRRIEESSTRKDAKERHPTDKDKDNRHTQDVRDVNKE